MATYSRPRIESFETKGLGFCHTDDIPNVDSQLMTESGHLIDQGDVDVTIGILEQLRHLCFTRASCGHHHVDELGVEAHGAAGARLSEAPNYLRGVLDTEVWVTWVNPLRAESEREIPASDEARELFNNRCQKLLSSSGIRGRFQHDQGIGPQVVTDCLSSRPHCRQVRSSFLRQRSGNADDDGLGILQHAWIRGGE